MSFHNERFRAAVIVISTPNFQRDDLMARAIQQMQEKSGENLHLVDMGAALEEFGPRRHGDFELAAKLMACRADKARSDRWEQNPLCGESWVRSGKRRGRKK